MSESGGSDTEPAGVGITFHNGRGYGQSTPKQVSIQSGQETSSYVLCKEMST